MWYVKQTFRRVLYGATLLSAFLFPSNTVLAQCANGIQSCSNNYSTDQTFFGSGGELNACSTGGTGYCSKQTAGELTVGNTKGTAYQAYAGFNTTDVPFLEFVVTANNINLGLLNTGTTATANGTFSVRAWQAGGYTVVTASDPPRNNNYTLAGLTTPTASAAGTEQFGINLVANTSPATFGAVPQQLPDSTFSFGIAEPGYNTANLYKYVKNDIIARSNSSTSVTTYTVSYIFNIKPSTAGGTYTFNHVLVATGTY